MTHDPSIRTLCKQYIEAYRHYFNPREMHDPSVRTLADWRPTNAKVSIVILPKKDKP